MIHLYYHGGSTNHGCEAIVRSTVDLIQRQMLLWSFFPEEDKQYGLNQIIEIKQDQYKPFIKKSFRYAKAVFEHKLLGNDYEFIKEGHKDFLQDVHPGDICLSIGGDNYCYSGIEKLGFYNKMLKKKGAKTVLWGCSVEPSVLTQKVVEDLKRYNLITVRESISYYGLLNAGIKENVVLCPDTAFILDKTEIPIPEGFLNGHVIGINASPLIFQYGHMVLENYIELIRYILEETNEAILLIPHVVKKKSDDRASLMKILQYFKGNERINLVDDHNCMKLKSLISQCRLFVGSRTHATIAAYSSCVPTLVSGYSVKANGIAKDLFGSYENYVLPVQKMKTPYDLKKSYCWVAEHEDLIRKHLKETIPSYQKRVQIAKTALSSLL